MRHQATGRRGQLSPVVRRGFLATGAVVALLGAGSGTALADDSHGGGNHHDGGDHGTAPPDGDGVEPCDNNVPVNIGDDTPAVTPLQALGVPVPESDGADQTCAAPEDP